MHWSAGGHTVSQLDRDHYHFIIAGNGDVVAGKYAPEDNISTSGGYAAHTLNCNTGSIGISLAAMAGAVESPFDPGSSPITAAQMDALPKLIKMLSEKYGIPITRHTVLSHAEVQPTLGIKQRGKWDISWIPGMDRPGDPVEVGDLIREMAGGAPVLDLPKARPLLRKGASGPSVAELQALLGFTGGDIDGDFGPKTEAAVQSFQRKHGLDDDGIVGDNTWNALDNT